MPQQAMTLPSFQPIYGQVHCQGGQDHDVANAHALDAGLQLLPVTGGHGGLRNGVRGGEAGIRGGA